MTTTALTTRVPIPTSIIKDPKVMAQGMVSWQETHHVLGPRVVSALGASYGVSFSVVRVDARIDPKGMGPECYRDKTLTANERRLGKVALDKLSAAAGISWLPASGRTDDRTDALYYEFTAYGRYKQYDGSEVAISGTVALDFRAGSPDMAWWSACRMPRSSSTDFTCSSSRRTRLTRCGAVSTGSCGKRATPTRPR